MMERSGLRLQRYVCKSCRNSIVSKPLTKSITTRTKSASLLTTHPGHGYITFDTNTVAASQIQRRWKTSSKPQATQDSRKSTGGTVDIAELERQVNTLIDANDSALPSEEQCVATMEMLEAVAQDLVETHNLEAPDISTQEGKDTLTATSAILSLDARIQERKGARRRAAPTPPHINDTVNALSLLAYRFISHETVFISTDMLLHYTKLQALLSRPESLPEVFDLYANKPRLAPTKKRGEFNSSPAKPNMPDAAIPQVTASIALGAALHVRNLPLALSVVITSFQRKAFRRAKAVRRALPPFVGASLLPVALWTAATNLASIQTGMDPQTFTNMAFAGSATYVGVVGTMGYVAMTSANDQMRRVTWAPGMPLWERWAREEERAAVDRIVCAWGFADKRRWGEEEGSDWQELKEWAGREGMVVDRVALMEGMQ